MGLRLTQESYNNLVKALDPIYQLQGNIASLEGDVYSNILKLCASDMILYFQSRRRVHEGSVLISQIT